MREEKLKLFKVNINEKEYERLSVTRKELPSLLGCGQPTADKIADEAEAKVFIGRRLLISVDKIRDYLIENGI